MILKCGETQLSGSLGDGLPSFQEEGSGALPACGHFILVLDGDAGRCGP